MDKWINYNEGAFPSPETLEDELYRVKYHKRFLDTIRSTVFMLVVVAAAAVLVAVLLLPILRIYGQSMGGTLEHGDIVASVKGADFKTGDIIAFYYNNNILVKRVIGVSGDWVDITEDGTVYVNQVKLEEPYVHEKAFGQTDIDLPYQVPEARIFVMGDNRTVSIDSRNTTIGCVAEEQIVGRIIFRLWPFENMGWVR